MMNELVYNEAVKLSQRAVASGASGRTVGPDELAALNEEMKGRIPEWYIHLLSAIPICGLEFAWRGDDGSQGLIEWSDAEGTRSESLECYPGLAILERGYVNVGSDPTGSGDPYFIDTRKGNDPPVVQVYHDVSDQTDEILENAVNVISPNLSQLFRDASFED